MSLKSFLQFLWSGKSPLNYLVTSFEHLDQKSHVGSHMTKKEPNLVHTLHVFDKKSPGCWITRAMCIK